MVPAIVLFSVLVELPAHPCYTGLVDIPTAEVIESGQCGLELQFDGAFARRRADTRIFNTEFGLNQRLEAGVDFDLSHDVQARTLLNAKYMLSTRGNHSPALAVGICNVGRNVKSTPYVVATQQFKVLRSHLGGVRIEGNHRWFIGADRAITDRLTLIADCTSGSENSSTAGASYQFNDRFGILAGVTFPNARDEDARFTVHFVFSGPYRRAEKGR
jgi:hypothetical protein